MKLVSIGAPGAQRPAILTEPGRLVSTDALLATLGIAPLDTNDLLGLWDGIGPLLAEAVMRHSAEFAIRAQEVRFGPPVPHPRKVIGVGLNYLAPGANLGRTTNKSATLSLPVTPRRRENLSHPVPSGDASTA